MPPFPNASDWSAYQGVGDLDAYASSGRTEGRFKVTEGPGTYTSPVFARSRDECQRVGLSAIGLYHFLSSSVNGTIDGRGEADFFLSRVGDPRPGEYPICDAENNQGLSPDDYGSHIVAFAERVSDGWQPGLFYTYTGMTERVADWAYRRLAELGWLGWPAAYPNAVRDPDAPPALPHLSTASWQFTSTGYVPGIGGAVDDSFVYVDMAAFAGGVTPIDSSTEELTMLFYQSIENAWIYSSDTLHRRYIDDWDEELRTLQWTAAFAGVKNVGVQRVPQAVLDAIPEVRA